MPEARCRSSLVLSIPEAAGYSMPDLTPAQRRSAAIASNQRRLDTPHRRRRNRCC